LRALRSFCKGLNLFFSRNSFIRQSKYSYLLLLIRRRLAQKKALALLRITSKACAQNQSPRLPSRVVTAKAPVTNQISALFKILHRQSGFNKFPIPPSYAGVPQYSSSLKKKRNSLETAFALLDFRGTTLKPTAHKDCQAYSLFFCGSSKYFLARSLLFFEQKLKHVLPVFKVCPRFARQVRLWKHRWLPGHPNHKTSQKKLED
jgi:hypothetical protein